MTLQDTFYRIEISYLVAEISNLRRAYITKRPTT